MKGEVGLRGDRGDNAIAGDRGDPGEFIRDLCQTELVHEYKTKRRHW